MTDNLVIFLQPEDNLKNEDDLKNEDNLKNEDYLGKRILVKLPFKRFPKESSKPNK